ncbi:hypothetical protein [Flavobacterium sp.]|uniref:hypothetical protein n=1 Tax=Flavobacterium sp. TaxID=239 RepID=UPI00261E07CC|nr:hypothetical protein [Flavobacterium sp.]
MIYTKNGVTRKANQRVGTIKLQTMKNLQCTDFKQSKQKNNKLVSFTGVKVVLASLILTAFVAVSCSKEDVQENVPTKENAKDTANSSRYYYYDSIIVHNWGSHNIDCSQPNGFCYEVWTITYSFFKPQPTGTPVKVQNVNGAFVMKLYKSALTEENRRTLLRNGNSYSIPEGQTIAPELVESLGFRSNTLREGNYRIVENTDSYSITIAVN